MSSSDAFPLYSTDPTVSGHKAMSHIWFPNPYAIAKNFLVNLNGFDIINLEITQGIYAAYSVISILAPSRRCNMAVSMSCTDIIPKSHASVKARNSSSSTFAVP